MRAKERLTKGMNETSRLMSRRRLEKRGEKDGQRKIFRKVETLRLTSSRRRKKRDEKDGQRKIQMNE
jgi:hypothetical protein